MVLLDPLYRALMLLLYYLNLIQNPIISCLQLSYRSLVYHYEIDPTIINQIYLIPTAFVAILGSFFRFAASLHTVCSQIVPTIFIYLS